MTFVTGGNRRLITFFSHMKLPHIVQALSQAGLAGAAQDAAKMKKKDAAEHAEHFLSKKSVGFRNG
uniref:Putative ParB-like nuclease n=1 Tax=Klebsiella pneumoniae TaxID=573 RepID=A0A8B0SQ95_KLEPN|nr:putative ParB-like nuclease [Klebsiella pneumoniae]